jgi:hypothetical protein
MELGGQVRQILSKYGGTDELMAQYNQVQAYHNNNYLPLLWNIHRPHRSALHQLLSLLDIRSATQQTGELVHDAPLWTGSPLCLMRLNS